MIIQGNTRAPSNVSNTDGSYYDLLLDKLGGLIVSELGGKYLTQAYRKNIYFGSTTNAGIAIPADDATAQKFMLWNPAGSNVLCVPIHLRGGIATLGTRVVSSIQLNFLPNAGSALGASGAPITAWTDTAAKSTYIGTTGNAMVKFSLAATTIAMTSYFQLGYYHDLAGGGSPPPFIIDFDGTVILPPNNAMALQSTDAATGSTYALTIVWLEIPL